MALFKNKNEEKPEQLGKDSTIDSAALFQGEAAEASEKEIKPKLSFHPSMEITPEDKYYFQYLNNELAPLKENQLSISGVDLKLSKNGVKIAAIIRNSVAKPIVLPQIPLLFLDKDGKVLGRKVFDLSQLGEIPAESSRPWFFDFGNEEAAIEEAPEKGWQLAFELKAPHSLDLEESWRQALPVKEQENLANYVQSLEAPKPGEVNFMGINIARAENKDLHVTLLIRNGSDKGIAFQQIPLIVEDAAGEVIAKGSFAVNDLEVKANTSKPWSFVFPADLVLKENPDLSKWRAYPPRQ